VQKGINFIDPKRLSFASIETRKYFKVEQGAAHGNLCRKQFTEEQIGAAHRNISCKNANQ
jgi:hypothetical protein